MKNRGNHQHGIAWSSNRHSVAFACGIFWERDFARTLWTVCGILWERDFARTLWTVHRLWHKTQVFFGMGTFSPWHDNSTGFQNTSIYVVPKHLWHWYVANRLIQIRRRRWSLLFDLKRPKRCCNSTRHCFRLFRRSSVDLICSTIDFSFFLKQWDPLFCSILRLLSLEEPRVSLLPQIKL